MPTPTPVKRQLLQMELESSYYAGPKALVVCGFRGGLLGRKPVGDRRERQSIGQQENPAPLGPRVTRHDHMAFLPRQALDKQASKQVSKQASKPASKQAGRQESKQTNKTAEEQARQQVDK